MSKAVEVITVPAGQSGKIEHFDEEQNGRLVELVLQGERDPIRLANALGSNLFSVRNALKNPRVLAAINAVVKAKATLLKVAALDSAEKDLQFGSEKSRGEARKFIVAVADGETAINVNNINSWDPTKDEELWARGERFFKQHGRAIAAETVREVLEQGEDILDG